MVDVSLTVSIFLPGNETYLQSFSAQVDASGFPPLKADFRPITRF